MSKSSNKPPGRNAVADAERLQQSLEQKAVAAEATLTKLQTEREQLVGRRVEHDAERARIAYAAKAQGDPEASKRLAEMVDEAIRIEHQLRDLDAAIKTATEKLAEQKRAVVRAGDMVNAVKLRAVVKQFVQTGNELHETLTDLAEIGAELTRLLDQMHALGCMRPSREQLDSLGGRAMRTAMQATPWRRYFETVAPSERYSFATLITGWAASIERDIAVRLDEPKDQEAA
jgi:hypothetical protein